LAPPPLRPCGPTSKKFVSTIRSRPLLSVTVPPSPASPPPSPPGALTRNCPGEPPMTRSWVELAREILTVPPLNCPAPAASTSVESPGNAVKDAIFSVTEPPFPHSVAFALIRSSEVRSPPDPVWMLIFPPFPNPAPPLARRSTSGPILMPPLPLLTMLMEPPLFAGPRLSPPLALTSLPEIPLDVTGTPIENGNRLLTLMLMLPPVP